MKRKIIQSSGAPSPIGPYSQAVLANGVLYVSGQIPLLADSGDIVEGDIEEQTHQVMRNLGAILNGSGLTFRDVVKCTIYVRDMNNFAGINGVYGQYFSDIPPARETVEVSRLPKDVGVEISCIAVGNS